VIRVIRLKLQRLNALAALSTLLLLGVSAVALTRRVDAYSAERYGYALRTLLALDFKLTTEVLKARAGVVSHYDGIVQTSAARKRLQRTLGELPGFLPEVAQRGLRAELQAAERTRAESESMVERFKRAHAVLRNSLRFMPVLASELDRPEVAALVQDALLMQSWDDPAIRARFDRNLARLTADLLAAPASAQASFDALLLHAQLARERAPLVNALTRQIVALAEAAHAQTIAAHFEHELQRAVRREARTAGLVFALAVATLMLWAAAAIVRLRAAGEAQRRSAQQLAAALAALREEQAKQLELSELKTRFVAMTSHEFRTPLSVIMSSSDMLEAYTERWSSEKKAEHFSRIRTAAVGMTRMLDAILLIGRSDAGALQLEPRPVELARFCAEVLAAVEQANTGTALILPRIPEQPHWIVADERMLRQVLENLLSNALKYSPDGKPVLCEVAHRDGELLLRVQDSGIGIAEDDQPHLFETFSRGGNVGGISGTGLGLAVVGRAVKLHGGSISVHSQLGVGSEFTVRIPMPAG
jgi:signal transduction histidine kinase